MVGDSLMLEMASYTAPKTVAVSGNLFYHVYHALSPDEAHYTMLLPPIWTGLKQIKSSNLKSEMSNVAMVVSSLLEQIILAMVTLIWF